jgi:hypothetical protein
MGCSVVLQLKGGGWGLESNCHRKRVLALSEYSYGFKHSESDFSKYNDGSFTL